jgi:hypothetical protein
MVVSVTSKQQMLLINKEVFSIMHIGNKKKDFTKASYKRPCMNYQLIFFICYSFTKNMYLGVEFFGFIIHSISTHTHANKDF